MKVIRARSAGFCWGVERAVAKARETVARTGSRVYTDGPLIHNRQMAEALEAEGIRETRCPESLTAGDTLMLRTHGIAPERRRLLKALPVRIEDTTCPDVARIQAWARNYAAQSYTVLIYGDAGHAEVEGLLGHAGGRGFLVEREDDLDRAPVSERVCLISQSTQNPGDYAKIAAAARARFPEIVVLDTICESTRRRQEELEEMAEQVEAFVVVGGRHSANTLRLAALAASLRPTLAIETETDIEPAALARYGTVGLTAGASTPDFVIDAVERRLRAL